MANIAPPPPPGRADLTLDVDETEDANVLARWARAWMRSGRDMGEREREIARAVFAASDLDAPEQITDR